MSSHGRIDCAVGHSGSNGVTADSPQKPALESLDVRRVNPYQIGDTARQNVTEYPKTGAQHGLGFELPCDGSSGLQDREGRRGKHIAETGLNGGAQRLIHIMRDRRERAPKTSNLLMRI